MATESRPEIRLDSYRLDEVCGGRVEPAGAVVVFRGVAYDSRHVQPGNLFVALRGERTDGHRFLHDAVAAGAGALLIEHGYQDARGIPTRVPRIRAANTQAALAKLAAWHRDQFTIPFVAVTGSNGKTTTKELCAATLACAFAVFKTPGNLNSQVGLPAAMFDLDRRATAAVCELGMSRRGEIDLLARIVRPRYGIITNIAPAHLETLGSIEAVAQAKFELLQHIAPSGLALLCADDPVLARKAGEMGKRARTFGIDQKADLVARRIRAVEEGTRFAIEGDLEVYLPLFGRHNVYNALAALLLAREMGVDMLAATAALAVFRPAAHRSALVRAGAVTLIDDAYNANPQAVLAAVNALAEYPAPARRVAVLGDMLELGPEEVHYHRRIGARLAELNLDFVVTVGTLAREVERAARGEGLDPARLLHFADSASCAAAAAAWSRPGDTILVKGSRGVALEAVVSALRKLYDQNAKEES
jgi:UDP-N-acetylmuramoyl-tripeptide--D-alanyl-D-alanine ligase